MLNVTMQSLTKFRVIIIIFYILHTLHFTFLNFIIENTAW